MTKSKKFGVISVVAHPHPEGAYRALFEQIARKPAKFHGDQHAALSPISRSRDGIFQGRLAVWTQVDDSSDVIDLDRFEEVSFTDSDVIIPTKTGLLSKVLQFAFNEKNHRLYIELENEQGKKMSAGRIELAISKILEIHAKGYDATVVPDQQSVSRALKMPGLRRVEIRINRPNPDDFDDEVADIVEELEGQGAKSEKVEIAKASSVPKLTLNERNTKLAKVGSVTGYFKAFGKAENGEDLEYSTKKHPQIIPREVDSDSSTTVVLNLIAADES